MITAFAPARHSLWLGLTGAVSAAWVAITILMWHRNQHGWDIIGSGLAEHLDPGTAAAWFPISLLGFPSLNLLGHTINDVPADALVSNYVGGYAQAMVLLGLFGAAFLAGSRRAETEPAARGNPVGGASFGPAAMVDSRLSPPSATSWSTT